MPAVHEVGAEALLDRMMDHPGASRTLAETRHRLRLPGDHPMAFNSDYVDAIGQIFRADPGRWPMEQVAAFTAVHTKLCSGEVLQVLIGCEGMDGGPKPDRKRRENAAKLADLPSPFEAEVDATQNAGDYDGTLKWHAPIRMYGATGAVFLDPCRRSAKQPVGIVRTITDGWAPLEIGYTQPSRTLLHLLEMGAVARWPYGSDYIRLFVRRCEPVRLSLT